MVGRIRISAIGPPPSCTSTALRPLAPTLWTLSDTSSSSIGTLLDGLAPTTAHLVQGRAYGKRGCSDRSDSATVAT